MVVIAVFVVCVCVVCLLAVLPNVGRRECRPSQVVRLLLIATIYWIPTTCLALCEDLTSTVSNPQNNPVNYIKPSFYKPGS